MVYFPYMHTSSIIRSGLRSVVFATFVAAVLMGGFFALMPQAHAATTTTTASKSLTEAQITAILNLLASFNVPQATINNVSAILHKKS